MKKIIFFLILLISIFGVNNTNAFTTGTVLVSNFNQYVPTIAYTHCNNATNKCYFIKSAGTASALTLFNANGGALISTSNGFNSLTNYGPYIFAYISNYQGGAIYYILKVIDTTNDSVYSAPYTTYGVNFGNQGMNINKVGDYIYFTRKFVVSIYTVYDTIKYSLLTNTAIQLDLSTDATYLNFTGFNIPTLLNALNSQNYIIGNDIYYFRANEFYKSTLGSNTETKILTGLSYNIKTYNYYKSNNGLYYLSFTFSNPGVTLSYFNTASYNGTAFTSLGNKYILFEKLNTNTYISVENLDYMNFMYTSSTAPVFAPMYNSLNNNYNLNYIGKDNSLYSSAGFTAGIDGGGGGSTSTGSTLPILSGTGLSLTSITTRKGDQTCVAQNFSVTSGTGTSEIIYSNLSTGSLYNGQLYTNNNLIVTSSISDIDVLNLFNDTQLTFQTIEAPIIATTFLIKPLVSQLPKTIEIYTGNPINGNYGPTTFNVTLYDEDRNKFVVPSFIGMYGNKYTVKIDDLKKISLMVLNVDGGSKMPTLQKIRLYGDNTLQTKTRYACNLGEKSCNWIDYYTSEKKPYCIEKGDFNEIKPEYIPNTTSQTGSFDFSNLLNGIQSIFSGNSSDIPTDLNPEDYLTGETLFNYTGSTSTGTIPSKTLGTGTGNIVFYNSGIYISYGSSGSSYSLSSISNTNSGEINLKDSFTKCPAGLQNIDISFFNFLSWGLDFDLPFIDYRINFYPFYSFSCPIKSVVNTYNYIKSKSLN